jgi:membrane glycosyltransferase
VTVPTVPLGATVTFGEIVTAGDELVTVVVVFLVVLFCWTVVVFVTTLGAVALEPSESPLEMIAAASPPSASTMTTPRATSQPLVPERCSGA